MKFNFKITTIILTVLVPHPLYPYTFLGRNLPGDKIHAITAKSLSMGNVNLSFVDEPNVYLNPASLINFDSPQILVSFGIIPAEEKIIAENSPVLYNLPVYTFFSGLFCYPKKYLSFGLGIHPVYNLQYTSEQKIYRASELAKIVTYKNTGVIYSITIALSTKLKITSLGVAISSLISDYEVVQREYDVKYRIESTMITRHSLLGNSLTISSILNLTENINLSLFYMPAFQLKNSVVTKIPAQYGLSLTKRFGPLSTLLVFEITSELDKKAEIKLGAEHMLLEKYPVRYGFSLIPHTNDNRFYSFSISLGTALTLTRSLALDLALACENINILTDQNYIQQNIYKVLCSAKFSF